MIITNAMMKQRQSAYSRNLENILACVTADPDAYLCDLGCDDGKWTRKVGAACKTKNLYGVEIVEERRKQAEAAGIKALSANLNGRIPYEDGFFHIVHANQVIEHLSDTDMFLSEIYRVLRPGGYTILSTENLASWHNVFALFLGYTPFSLTNTTSRTAALGNPLAPHNNESFWESASWQHKTVFTTRGLIHLLTLHGFGVEAVKGAGYYPFGNAFSHMDPYHCAFITIKGSKA